MPRDPKPSRYVVQYADPIRRRLALDVITAQSPDLPRPEDFLNSEDYWTEADFRSERQARQFLETPEAKTEGAILYERTGIEWEYGWRYELRLIAQT